MYTPKALEHAKRLQAGVINTMETDPGLSQIYDEDTKQYFKNFMEAVLKGQFEELSDVSLFINVGSDANNLSLYGTYVAGEEFVLKMYTKQCAQLEGPGVLVPKQEKIIS